MTATASRFEAAYARHLRRCAPELVQHEADTNYDRTLRACMKAIQWLAWVAAEQRNAAEALVAEGEALTDWQGIAEARRGR